MINGIKKKVVPTLAILITVFLITGCSTSLIPGDKEAVRLVEKHYLYYYDGQKVQAEIKKSGDFLGECDCYSMVFTIASSGTYYKDKVFYFFKNSSGSLEVREHKFGLKNVQG